MYSSSTLSCILNGGKCTKQIHMQPGCTMYYSMFIADCQCIPLGSLFYGPMASGGLGLAGFMRCALIIFAIISWLLRLIHLMYVGYMQLHHAESGPA